MSTLLLRLANVAVTAVVAHILAPREFGVFTVALTAFTIISSLNELGLASCLIRADLDIDVMAPTMVTVSMVMSALFAEAMAVSARPIAAALGSADGAQPIRILALAVLLSGLFTVPGAQLTRDFKQDKHFLANIISLLPSTAVLLLLAKSGGGATAFAWSRVVASLVMGCVMVASVPKHYRPGISRVALGVLFRFGLPLAGANVTNYVLVNVDYAFVGHLMGAVPLGTYMLAFTLASSPGLLLGNVINSVAMPAFSRVKHNADLLRNAMTSALRVVSLILMPMCGLMMALASPIVLTLYGAKWAASAEVLSILSLYGAISIICVLFANMLTSLGKARFTLGVQLLWLGALIPAMALGVRRDGIVGAAAAHIAVIGPLVLPSYLFALRKATGVRFVPLGKAVFPPLLAAAAASLAARAVASHFASPLAQLVAGLAAGGLIYFMAAAPLAAAGLSKEQAAKLHALSLFRFYDTAARLVRLRAGSGAERRDGGGRHRAGNAVGTMRCESATATLPLPSVSEGPRTSDGLDFAVPCRVTGLLRPEAEVVPFWPRHELGELLDWCRAPGQVAVRLVTGEGGAGKTRLAIELARRLEAYGWWALWVQPGADPEAVATARRVARPAVLLVDDAETRAGLVRLLADAATSVSGHCLRVVLLARSAGEWWRQLISSAGNQLGDMLALATAQQVRLGPVRDRGVQRGIFDAAVTEFAARLGVIRPAAELTSPDTDTDTVVLVVHAAALSAVLDHNEPGVGERFRGGAEVLQSMLQREIRYCTQAAAACGLDLDPGTLRRAVAAACLIGAESEPAATALLRRLPDLAESAERRSQVARWLRDLYPDQPAPDRRAAGWLGALRQDRVAEQLIVGELAARPDLIPALFTRLDESRARRALTVLARAALNHPHATRLLGGALEADFEHLAIPALAVAVETNPMMDRLLAGIVAARVISTQTLERIAAAIPQRSSALAETAITVLSRLADSAPADSAQRASWLSDLGTRLADLGRQEEAIASIEEAHTIWRTLARARRDTYLPSVATSLHNGSRPKQDPGRAAPGQAEGPWA